MKSEEYLNETLEVVFRALNTMDGLITEVMSVIPNNILENEGPEDCDENTLATFGELEGLREVSADIVSEIIVFNSGNSLLGKSPASFMDEIGEDTQKADKLISEILEKYKGDVVSDEY